MKRFLTISLSIIIGVTCALAQATFKIIPPRNVIEGRNFQVVYRLSNGQGNAFNAPQINGCTLRYGPATSTSSSTQIINGNVTSSYTVDYTYTYYADKEGTYTIPEATIMVDGKKLTAPAQQFKVIAGESDPQRDPNGGGGGNPYGGYGTQQSQQISQDDIFVRVILNKSNVYEQEAVECVLKLYTKHNITSFSVVTPADYDGFLIDEVQLQPELNNVENYNGKIYHTAILKKAILFPQKSGKLTVNSGAYEVTVQTLEQINSGYFIMSRPTERNLRLKNYTESLEVKPLPQPKPYGFNGAVGRFSITSNLTSDALRTGEAASLTYTIKGTGNIKYLKQPYVEFPSEFEQYSPKQDYNTRVSGSTVTGTMTAEYTFVPESVGKFNIKGLEFVYFDPSDGEYHTEQTPDYEISVAKGVSNGSNNVDQQSIKLKNTDILHIKLGDKGQSLTHSQLADSIIYWIIYPLLLLVFAAFCIIYAKRLKANADISGRKVAHASKVARKRLALASKAMKEGKREAFYDATLKAIWGYLSDKLAIPMSGLTRSNISDELLRYGASEEMCKDVISVLDDCEMARYTPDEPSLSPQAIYSRAESVMDRLETVKRRK